ncbi:MAG: YARHG domain-containing protein [Cytophagales bacterium]|nr:YARHG domain-containing protein [Cytophagales bacterium]
MKNLLLLLLFITQFAAFAQSPNQQPIPEFVLKGKSANELRILRNEIFARYGYIFKSSDLTEYFKTKLWYKPKNTNVDDQLTDIDKSNIERILNFENLAKQDSFNPSIASETDAYFRVYKDPITGNKLETSRNVTFHRHFKYGTIRKVVERTFTGAEKFPTVIYAESTDPSKPFWETIKYYDDLKFKTNYFHAVEYGCCGEENYGELFTYNSDEPFLKFNESYFTVDIPNSKIHMFIGYCHENSGRDGATISTLYLSTLNGVVSSITFVATSQESKEDLPWYFTPTVELRTENEKNKIIRGGKEIRLWGSNFAKTLSDISGLSIFIEFWSEGTGEKAQFNIPITNGKFFGANELNTKITVNLESEDANRR